MEPYTAAFPRGSRVRVVDRSTLEAFLREWKLHHKLTPAQLGYADTVATVTDVSYYHGGDVLYGLAGVPGIWHEECLRAAGV